MALSGLINIRLINYLLVFYFSILPAIPQNINSIDLEEIPQRRVRKYIVSREINLMKDFSLIHASWKKDVNESDFNINEKTFFLKNDITKVWDSYSNVHPVETWNRQSIRFGLLISKCSNSVVYTNNYTSPEVDTGQVYFLNLRIIKGLINIPVAFEITNIDPVTQLLEFSYIDNNKSQGKQTIQFFDNGDGRTKIVHRSYFKSSSWVRDDLLYPVFHKKFIKEFHRNMRQLVMNKKQIIAVKD